MADNTTVLVTGGTGFIGSHVTRSLLEEGLEVVVFDISRDKSVLERLGVADHVRFVHGDISDPASVYRTVHETGATRIVHLASLLTTDVDDHPRSAIDVNIAGTNAILEVARTFDDQIDRVAWASSSSVYARRWRYGSGRIEEGDLLDPINLYGATKMYNEQQASHYRERYEVSVVGLRPALVYGPFRDSGGSAFFNELVEKPAVGEPFELEYSDEPLSWLYVDDLARAFTRAVLAPDDALSREVYNVRGPMATVKEVAEIVRSIVPDADIRIEDGEEVGLPLNLEMARIRGDLEFEREYDLEAGIREHVNTVRRHHGLDPVP